MNKIAWSMLKSCLKTSLAQAVLGGEIKSISKIHDLLRSFSPENKTMNAAGLSSIVTEDKDFKKASEIVDMNKDNKLAAAAPFEFELYDKKGKSVPYRFAVYKMSFKAPEEDDKVSDSIADVKGKVMDVKKDEILEMLRQGKADKFVAGIENKEDPNARFNYDLIGIQPPEAKKAFVIGYDPQTRRLKETNQMTAIQTDYNNYVNELKTKVEDYNFQISDKLNQKYPPVPPAMPPGGAMPPPLMGGMPPMGGDY